MLKKLGSEYVYNTHESIGKGTYGEVYLGIHNKTNEKVAIKVIKLDTVPMAESKLHLESFKNEMTNMQLAENPHIVRLLSVHMSPNNLYLICQYCNGGNLEQYIRSKGRLSEQETLVFLGEMLEGFQCLVSNHIAHRDFKPGNVMLHNYSVKIGDFGFSKVIDENCQLLVSSVGTPQYMSPQILDGEKYTVKTDIWSLGMVVYQMLYGKTPWRPSTNPKIKAKLYQLRNNISIEPLKFPETPKVTQETKQLIRRMLTVSEENRISWEELFQFNFKREFNLKHQLDEIVLESKELEKEKVRGFARLYFQFNKSIQDAHQILKNQSQNAHFFNSHNISMLSQLTQNSHYEENFRKYHETKRSKAVVDKIEGMFLNRRNYAVYFANIYFKLLDILQLNIFKETQLIQTCMILYLKESFILLFENFQLLNTESSNNQYNMFVETEEGQLVKVLSRYDNTIISMLFNTVLSELAGSLQGSDWYSEIQFLLNSNYQNNITPIIKKYTQILISFFKNSFSYLNFDQGVEKRLLVLMRMMVDYSNGTFNVGAEQAFNLVRFEEDIQKEDLLTLRSKLGICKAPFINGLGSMGMNLLKMSLRLGKQDR